MLRVRKRLLLLRLLRSLPLLLPLLSQSLRHLRLRLLLRRRRLLLLLLMPPRRVRHNSPPLLPQVQPPILRSRRASL
ncbi:hypothetical protein F183_A53510 [Bryobacterales bacterium F-183]|nr:hypothetical protein F183_A53510 [Bryobacterales bacterium F-183]